jgi:hypothetical protein
MALSDLAVFSEYAYSTMTEMQDQQIGLFNAATRGGLVLQSGNHQGDYSDEAMWAKISGLVRRRNAYGSGAVAEKVLEHLTETSVKVAAGTPPVRIDPGMMKWIQRSPEEAGVVVGRQMAEDSIADMLNTAIMCYTAAVGQVANVVYDHSSTGPMSLIALNKGAAKFGDRASALVAWVMHSKSAFDIYGEALTNANRLFVFGNVRVIEDGFGRPLVVTDSPNLILPDAGGPGVDHYLALGLTPGAVVVSQNGDFTDNVETKNGDENIIRTYQAEWSYNVSVQGFAWDKTNGGKSPTNSALGTATNWDRYATSDKDLAGVLVKAQ